MKPHCGNPITPERRAEILSRDVLGITDLGDLLGVEYDGAALIVRNIRRGVIAKGAIRPQGKIFLQDYIDYYKLDIRRYIPLAGDKLPSETLLSS